MSDLRYLEIPYRPWGMSFEGCDCWGLVVLWYRHELGRELPTVAPSGRLTALEFSKAIKHVHAPLWVEVLPPYRRGDVVYFPEPNPHCGVLVNSYLLLHIDHQVGHGYFSRLDDPMLPPKRVIYRWRT